LGRNDSAPGGGGGGTRGRGPGRLKGSSGRGPAPLEKLAPPGLWGNGGQKTGGFAHVSALNFSSDSVIKDWSRIRRSSSWRVFFLWTRMLPRTGALAPFAGFSFSFVGDDLRSQEFPGGGPGLGRFWWLGWAGGGGNRETGRDCESRDRGHWFFRVSGRHLGFVSVERFSRESAKKPVFRCGNSTGARRGIPRPEIRGGGPGGRHQTRAGPPKDLGPGIFKTPVWFFPCPGQGGARNFSSRTLAMASSGKGAAPRGEICLGGSCDPGRGGRFRLEFLTDWVRKLLLYARVLP